MRELESCIERAVVLSQDGTISMNLLPINIRTFKQDERARELTGSTEEVISALVARLRPGRPGAVSNLYERVISRVEKALLTQVLERNDHVRIRAARELGLSRNTLSKKMKRLGIPGE